MRKKIDKFPRHGRHRINAADDMLKELKFPHDEQEEQIGIDEQVEHTLEAAREADMYMSKT
jgi:hypothetical protein